jgi:hypothetical protein
MVMTGVSGEIGVFGTSSSGFSERVLSVGGGAGLLVWLRAAAESSRRQTAAWVKLFKGSSRSWERVIRNRSTMSGRRVLPAVLAGGHVFINIAGKHKEATTVWMTTLSAVL